MILSSPLWFVEGLVDAEYQNYRLLAFLEEAKSHYSEYKLMPSYETSGFLNKAATCFLATGSVYAYMLQSETDFELLEKIESMSPDEVDEVRRYVAEMQPTLAEIRRFGEDIKRLCESRMTFEKQPGTTRRVFVNTGGGISKFLMSGDYLKPDGVVDAFPGVGGDVFVDVDLTFPLEETVVPVVQMNMWRFAS
jgi:hypothetical protein